MTSYVELKTLSNRKAGKEGPVSDCRSDSLTSTSVLCGMHIRVKGESQSDNVKELLRTIPPLAAADNVRLCFDRGYGKMPFIEETSAMRFNITTVAATLGSRHPFVTVEEREKLIDTWNKAAPPVPDHEREVSLADFKDFVVDSNNLIGSNTKIAVKDLVTTNGGIKKLVALAQLEKFDRKVPTNENKIARLILHFLSQK